MYSQPHHYGMEGWSLLKSTARGPDVLVRYDQRNLVRIGTYVLESVLEIGRRISQSSGKNQQRN